MYSRGLPGTVAEPADSLLRGLYILLKATKKNENAQFWQPVRRLGAQTTSAASRETAESSKLHPGRWSLARARISCEYVSGPLQILAIPTPTLFIKTYQNQCTCLLLAPGTSSGRPDELLSLQRRRKIIRITSRAPEPRAREDIMRRRVRTPANSGDP